MSKITLEYLLRRNLQKNIIVIAEAFATAKFTMALLFDNTHYKHEIF
jgi:hypothetical protein